MGADLYNHRYRDSNPHLVEVEQKMHALSHDADGNWRRNMPEPDRQEYSKCMDVLYGDALYYFRESYGGEGLLALMGLSWWQDVIPLIDINPPKGLSDEELEQWYNENTENMSPEACQQFIDLLQSRRAIVDAYPDNEWEEGRDWITGEPYRTNVGNWYRRRLEQLLAFLRNGVETGGIYASL